MLNGALSQARIILPHKQWGRDMRFPRGFVRHAWKKTGEKWFDPESRRWFEYVQLTLKGPFPPKLAGQDIGYVEDHWTGPGHWRLQMIAWLGPDGTAYPYSNEGTLLQPLKAGCHDWLMQDFCD
jgi:hypothetical protein